MSSFVRKDGEYGTETDTFHRILQLKNLKSKYYKIWNHSNIEFKTMDK